MSNTITISGNLTADPELRTTSSDVPFVRLRVAVSHRFQNVQTKEWEERQDGFFAVSAWRDLAVHARTSLRKGDRVNVTGRLIRRAYEASTGEGQTETRYVHEIEADDLGPSLRWRAWTRLDARPTVLDDLRDKAKARDDDPTSDPVADDDEPDVTVAA